MSDSGQIHKQPSGESILPFVLALVLIMGFLFLTGIIVCYYPSNLDLLKTMATIFLGPIGTILGFYFGQRPVEKLTDRVQELIQTNKDTLQQLEQRKRELEDERKAATMRLDDSDQKLQEASAVLKMMEEAAGQTKRSR